MDVHEHIEKETVKKTSQNKERARSLLAIATVKEMTISESVLTESNISAYLPMAYDSLREVLDALCILHGYKPQSHMHTGELAKTLHPSFDFITFDRFRYTRNRINYYGEKVDFHQGKELIKKMFQMKKEVEQEVKQLLEHPENNH